MEGNGIPPLPIKYRNLSQKIWAQYVDVKVPDFAKGETDMPGSNMRLKCKFCNHEFSGSKSRVVAHLIGDSTKCITTCPTAPIDAQVWA